jgi:hypothetical protein
MVVILRNQKLDSTSKEKEEPDAIEIADAAPDEN